MNISYLRDEYLVEGLKSGEDSAFEALLDIYGDRILKVCYLILKDYTSGEDAAQEVFIQVYKSIRNFKGNSSLYTWIYKIVVNKCRDILKKKHEYSTFDDSMEIEDSYDVEWEAIESIDKRRVKDIVFSMELKYREIITLFYFEDFSIKQICEILDEREGTVKSKLHRARNILRQVLVKEGIGHER